MNNNVEFKEEWNSSLGVREEKPSGFGSKLANFLMRRSGGAIKNEKQANKILIAVSVVILIISIYLFLK